MSAPAVSNPPYNALHTLLDNYVSAPSRHDDLDVALATVYAVKLGLLDGRSPLWLLFVDPPSSGKTDIVGTLRPDKEHVVFLDTLTAEAFLSGAVSKQGTRAAKLLPLLNHKCLVVKDLTTLFSLKHETVKKILGDLQSIYDGEFRKGYGTGFDGSAVIEAESYFGFLGTCAEYVRLGGTPIYTEDGVRLRGVPEEPFRIYQQLRLAVEAVAAVRGHTVVQPDDTRVVERIALSSIFYRRYEAVRALQS